jgi:hypothetical protein
MEDMWDHIDDLMKGHGSSKRLGNDQRNWHCVPLHCPAVVKVEQISNIEFFSYA